MKISISNSSLEELYTELNSAKEGLKNNIAAQKLAVQKKSIKIQKPFQRNVKLFISQFTNPLVLLLVVAVILSALLGEKTDTYIILFILSATGLLGFWQEWNAGKAVEQLQKMIQLKSDVVRESKQFEIDADDIVPGDIIVLKAGDIIPADCRLIETNELHVNESSITGESYPQEKIPGTVLDEKQMTEKINCLWQGTNVVSGTATALVVYTGTNTVLGQMAHSLLKAEETAFEKGIKHFGYFLMQITIVLSILILGVNIYFKKPLFESVLFALAIAVGMAPELLPAIMTFAMSAGARRMLKKKVIVKKLSSIFNFGEVNVLCTDKTGTITEGVIIVKEIIDIKGQPNLLASQFAYLNAKFQNGFANPIDDALKQLSESDTGYKKLNEIPYDFIRKRLSVAVSNDNGKKYLITKGAVSNVLDICDWFYNSDNNVQSLDSSNKEKIAQLYTDKCNSGLRAIGIAYKEISSDRVSRNDEQQMIFLGFILLEDPLKEGVIDALNQLKKLEVSVKIITGDNRFVAAYAATKIGITNPAILTGTEINNMSSEALINKAAKTDIFAEAEPNQKERIIKALQSSGLAVAYMGDGINDVAAIHAADTGISVNDAVDVAKQAADFVLLEKDLSVLAEGIYEGRKTFVNSLKYIFINTGSTFGSMLSMAGASMLLPFLPMLPKQILLINFLTDFPYMFVANDNVDEERLLKPAKWNLHRIRSFMIVFGIHSSIFDFITFFVLYKYFNLKDAPFQTGWFIESVLVQLFILFIVRTQKSFLKSKPGKGLLITSLFAFIITTWLPVSSFAAQLGLTMVNFKQAVAIALIVLAYIVTADLLKTIFFRISKE